MQDRARDWVLRQIADLRDFAALNGLPRLAEALDQARLVAGLELPARPPDPPGSARRPD